MNSSPILPAYTLIAHVDHANFLRGIKMRPIDEICSQIDHHRQRVFDLRKEASDINGGNNYLYWIEQEPKRQKLLAMADMHAAAANALKWAITGYGGEDDE